MFTKRFAISLQKMAGADLRPIGSLFYCISPRVERHIVYFLAATASIMSDPEMIIIRLSARCSNLFKDDEKYGAGKDSSRNKPIVKSTSNLWEQRPKAMFECLQS